MKIWSRNKLGAIPFIVAAILLYLAYHISHFILAWGLHLTGNDLFDALINMVIIFMATYFFGWLFEREHFQEFAKAHFPKIPLLGPMMLLLILPRKLEMIEIKTVPGFREEEGGWEYAILTRDPWEENGVIWYRAHTLGLGGRLFPRISSSHVRPTNRPDRDVWMSVFSMGLV